MNLKDKVVMITGAASGMGAATAKYLVNQGARVALLDLQLEKVKAIADSLGGLALAGDVSDETSISSAIEKIIEKYQQINVSINCAGIVMSGRVVGKKGPLPLEDFNQVIKVNLIGTFNVKNKHCVIVDDIVDTAGTLCQAALALKNKGALSVYAYCTHPILSGAAVQNIQQSSLDEIVVSDTIPLLEAAQNCSKIRQISISSLIAETISRITQKESVSSLFFD